MPQGKVKKVVVDRGFGFIEDENGQDLFFHHSALSEGAIETLREGQPVSYTVGRGPKGPRAETIRVTS